MYSKKLAFASAMSALTLALAPSGAYAQDAGQGNQVRNITLANPDSAPINEIVIPMGKSTVLRFDVDVSEAAIGNPDAADIVPLTSRSIYLLGKKNGSTNLTIYGKNKQVLGIIDVNVSYDTLGLKRRLHDSIPNENIEVHVSGGKIMLTGKVSNTAVSARAAQMAETFAPGSVVNAMELAGSQQVMLSVRFAEVERGAAKALGISTNADFDDNGVDGFRSEFINPIALDTNSFAFLRDQFDIGNVSVDVVLDAMEQKGMASILAEPTLIAVSGEPASFLAGGEFPVPVSATGANGNTQIQVEFKEFGVRLSFTPTVIGDTISMVVTPEVSELDKANGIQLNGIVIPGLTTRRTSTTVELKNGQSFSIAGLMQKRFVDGLEQMPGLGDTPILGALARSARYQRKETELAIIITPYIVEPVTDKLKTPFDSTIPPHEFELFLLGKVEKKASAAGQIAGASHVALAANNETDASSTVAPFGYVVK